MDEKLRGGGCSTDISSELMKNIPCLQQAENVIERNRGNGRLFFC